MSSYAEVAEQDALTRGYALPEGPQAVAALLEGRAEELYALFAPELQAEITLEQIAALPHQLQTDRVHFADPRTSFVFDGHLAGDTIEGTYFQYAGYPFVLTATEPRSPEAALDGRWEGTVFDPFGDFGGGEYFDFAVTFATVDGQLTADVEVTGEPAFPYANVSFTEHMPIASGPHQKERQLGFREGGLHYAVVRWGNAQLALVFLVSPEHQIIFWVIAPEWPLPPDPAEGIEVQTVFRLPFDGLWNIVNGGELNLENAHVTSQYARHAYDIDIWKDGGNTQGAGNQNEDFWVWNQPILAPADGVVITVVNDLPDNPLGETDLTHLAGNHIAIHTAPDEFVFLAHFREGSIVVREGEQVTAGQFLGRVGNSGNTLGPHLHIHLQNRPDPFHPETIGLPMRFSQMLADGLPVPPSIPLWGTFVQHAGCVLPPRLQEDGTKQQDRRHAQRTTGSHRTFRAGVGPGGILGGIRPRAEPPPPLARRSGGASGIA